MAKVDFNPFLEYVHGKYGRLVFRTRKGRVVLAHPPSGEPREPSAAQEEQRQRFREAAAYGRGVLKDPALRAIYQARADATGIPVFAVIIADCFVEPTIGEIDLSGYNGQPGGVIRITATDDMDVMRVEVEIHDSQGALVEQGEAHQDLAGGNRWTYTATAACKDTPLVTVTATDRPGNATVKTAGQPAGGPALTPPAA